MALILAIDDDLMLLDTFTLIVESFMPEHDVITASDGQRGLVLARSRKPALVLLDLSMPGLDGLDVCKQLKHNEETRYIPVIIMTGLNSDRNMKARILDAGADAFLNKPFDKSEMIAQIRAMLRLKELENALREERDKLKRIVREQSFELDQSNQRWSLVLQSTNEGIWDWDIKSGDAFFSDLWMEVLGYEPDELPGNIKTFYRLVAPDDFSDVQNAIQEYLEFKRPVFNIELRMRCKNGDYKWFLYRGQAVWDEENRPIRMVGTQSDITERKEMEKRLVHIAHHDPLTGLPNRSLFLDRLNQTIARAQRFNNMVGVMFLDLDGFKPVNDTYGHKVGDLLLQQVASRLLHTVRKLDSVARMGGDEFLVILADLKDEEAASSIADRVIEELNKKYVIRRNEIRISASIGIALYPNDTQNAENLVKFADTAMYHAKQEGKNQYRFYSSRKIYGETVTGFTSAELAGALKNREIQLFYQRIQSLGDGEFFGLEAQLVWPTKTHGLLKPDTFLYAVEDEDMISDLENLVWQGMIEHFQKWNERGLNPGVILYRMTPKQFFHIDLVQNLESSLEDSHLRGDYFTIIVPEDVLLQDVDYSKQIVSRLTGLGIGIVVDDFGTGHFAVPHFSEFDLNALRISRNLIMETEQNLKRENMIRTLVSFAHTLNMKIIARGIENERQFDRTRMLEIDLVQGPYVQNFIPFGQMTDYLHSRMETEGN